MKRICFFNSTAFWGGGEKVYLEYALAFKERGHDVFLVGKKNSPLLRKAMAAKLRTYPMTVGNLSFLNPFKYYTLIHFFRRHQIQVVVSSASQDLKLASIAAYLAHVPKIIGYRLLANPVKNTVLNRWLYGKILTKIATNSKATKRKILDHLSNHIPEDKIQAMPHGLKINPAPPQLLPQIKTKAKGIILGNAGRLTEQKGQQHLITVAKKLKAANIPFTLFIAGSGTLEEELKSAIQANQLDKEVILMGFVKNMESFMHSIDIFLLTSQWEGFGYVLAEAMLQQKPVIAFDISSNPELVIAEKTGYLVPNLDMDAFTKKIIHLTHNKSLRLLMGKAGRERIINDYNFDQQITAFENYISS